MKNIRTKRPAGGEILLGQKQLTARQLATRWGRHIETIRRWLEDKKLPGVFIGGRWQIPISAVESIEAGDKIIGAGDRT